jgi:hypothetical protein
VKEVLEQAKLTTEEARRAARPVDFGLRVTLLLVVLDDEPVEMRFGVGLVDLMWSAECCVLNKY